MHMNPSDLPMPPFVGDEMSFLQGLIEFKSFFAAQVWWAQILILLGLIAVTVAAFAIVYYVIKGIIYLIVEAVKLIIAIIKSIFKPSLVNQSSKTVSVAPAPTSAPVQQIIVTTPVQTTMQTSIPAVRTTMAPQQTVTVKPVAKSNLFCPMCGEAFTEQMIILSKNQSKVFCEYCGNGVDVPQ